MMATFRDTIAKHTVIALAVIFAAGWILGQVVS